MAYKDKDKQKEYVRKWIAHKRKVWFFENGPCSKCGSYNRLCTHHIDPKTKISHNVWSWAKERREKELKKCVILCEKCHNSLHAEQKKKIGPEGTTWCSKCQTFLPVKKFTKTNRRWNGYCCWCRKCRIKYEYPKRVRR